MSRVTATSANCNVTYSLWLTTLAPILSSLSRSVVNYQRPSYWSKLDFRFGSKAEVANHDSDVGITAKTTTAPARRDPE